MQLREGVLEVLGISLAKLPRECVSVVLERTSEGVGGDLEDRIGRGEEVRSEGERDDGRGRGALVRGGREPEGGQEGLVAEEDGETENREANLEHRAAEEVDDVVGLPVAELVRCGLKRGVR